MSDQPAFEVFDPETGRRYQIWSDGRIQGFGDAKCIINRIPSLLALAGGGDGAPARNDPMKVNG